MKKEFVEEALNQAICIAFEWVDYLEYVDKTEVGIKEDSVVITCMNGYKYSVNVECDSLGAIILDVTKECLRH